MKRKNELSKTYCILYNINKFIAQIGAERGNT